MVTQVQLQSINPTAQQSQRWIIQALLDLMEKIAYDKSKCSVEYTSEEPIGWKHNMALKL